MKLKALALLSFAFYNFLSSTNEIIVFTNSLNTHSTVIPCDKENMRPFLKTLCTALDLPYDPSKEIIHLKGNISPKEVILISKFLEEVYKASTQKTAFNCDTFYLENPELFEKLFKIIHAHLPEQEKEILKRFLKREQLRGELMSVLRIINILIFIAAFTTFILQTKQDFYETNQIVLFLSMMGIIFSGGSGMADFIIYFAYKKRKLLQAKLEVLKRLLQKVEHNELTPLVVKVENQSTANQT